MDQIPPCAECDGGMDSGHSNQLVRICGIAHNIPMNDAVTILAALAEPTRLAAIRLLWDGEEHCVCELMQRLGATQSRMSRHMATLKMAGLVVDRRDAQWVRYRRAPNMPPNVGCLIEAALALPAQPERIAA
jgi:ArsR family transcriptional regulator